MRHYTFICIKRCISGLTSLTMSFDWRLGPYGWLFLACRCLMMGALLRDPVLDGVPRPLCMGMQGSCCGSWWKGPQGCLWLGFMICILQPVHNVQSVYGYT